MDNEGVLFNGAQLWFIVFIYFEVFPPPGDASPFFTMVNLIALTLIYLVPAYVVWRVATGMYPSDVLPDTLLRSSSDENT